MATFLVTQGTQTQLANDPVGTTTYPVSKIDIGAAGASVPFTGTFLGGTLNVGTINTGTINTGTVDVISQLPPNSWGTTITSGTNTLGTIKAGVAGSVIYVTHMVISVGSASNVVIGNGGTSLPILGTLFFNANGGIVDTPINPPLQTSSGSALVYMQSVSGPMSITAQGFVR